ncbi:MAG: hypothetical protein U0744_12310 [Gemmataceae bacterium]
MTSSAAVFKDLGKRTGAVGMIVSKTQPPPQRDPRLVAALVA